MSFEGLVKTEFWYMNDSFSLTLDEIFYETFDKKLKFNWHQQQWKLKNAFVFGFSIKNLSAFYLFAFLPSWIVFLTELDHLTWDILWDFFHTY